MSAQIELHIEDSRRAGRPIVMIHGFPLSSQAFKHQFEPMMEAGLRPIAYDRRGFGHSEKPSDGYDYDTLADDLARVIEQLNLTDVVLLGFSMGGGEVARYVSRHGEGRLSGIILAAAVTPYLLKSADNPEGPLDPSTAAEKLAALQKDRDQYFEKFVKKFYDVDGEVVVSEEEITTGVELCRQSDPAAAVQCMQAFSSTDFREDLQRVTVPTLIIHGDADAVVPLAGSGQRTAQIISHAEFEVIRGGPHGINVSHATEFNRRVIEFVQTSCDATQSVQPSPARKTR